MKPHRGTLKNWHPQRIRSEPRGLGFILLGTFHGHPEFHGTDGWTSEVIALRPEINEVETRHSRYSVEQPPLGEAMALLKTLVPA